MWFLTVILSKMGCLKNNHTKQLIIHCPVIILSGFHCVWIRFKMYKRKFFLTRTFRTYFLRHGVNFINVLCEAFTPADPKSAKKRLMTWLSFVRFWHLHDEKPKFLEQWQKLLTVTQGRKGGRGGGTVSTKDTRGRGFKILQKNCRALFEWPLTISMLSSLGQTLLLRSSLMRPPSLAHISFNFLTPEFFCDKSAISICTTWIDKPKMRFYVN